jgi:hypothetical protein
MILVENAIISVENRKKFSHAVFSPQKDTEFSTACSQLTEM